jgi:hypothetical protein
MNYLEINASPYTNMRKIAGIPLQQFFAGIKLFVRRAAHYRL